MIGGLIVVLLVAAFLAGVGVGREVTIRAAKRADRIRRQRAAVTRTHRRARA